MPRSAPIRRRLPRLVTAGFAILATATLPAIFLPDAASADDVFNCYGTPFSEATYLSRYADVRAAVEAGGFPNGCAHFAAHGHAEGRSGTPDGWQPPGGEPTSNPSETPSENPNPQPTQTNPAEQPSDGPTSQPPDAPYSPVFNCYGTPFSESVYLERYADVREAVANGTYASGCAHFAAVGHTIGYSGTPTGWTEPSQPPTTPPIEIGPNDGKPRAAIALGDSFISGEGAGEYQPVPDQSGGVSGYPGPFGEDQNAFFCHRSANASLHRASLDNIDVRFNLACSGGQPFDVKDWPVARGQRRVDPQRSQLIRVAQGHDIDLVLIGLGSNNSHFSFGAVAKECIRGFLSDAFVGDTAFLLDPVSYLTTGEKVPRGGACEAGQFPSSGELDAAEAETYAALRELVATLRQVDSDGQHRIVLQDYTNPLPPDLAQKYHSERSAGRFDTGTGNHDDTDAKFRGLASERYEGGCPIHRRSLGPAHQFSQRLGQLVARNADRLREEFPGEAIVYLNVQNALNGARLCEMADSPNQALASAPRFAFGPDYRYEDSLNWMDKLQLKQLAKTCESYFHICQEAWHPNAGGHGVLGQCLSFAARTGDRSVICTRNPADGQIVDGPLPPPPVPPYEPPPCPENTDDGQFEHVPGQEQPCPQ